MSEFGTEGGLAFSTLIKSRDPHLAGGEKQNEETKSRTDQKSEQKTTVAGSYRSLEMLQLHCFEKS